MSLNQNIRYLTREMRAIQLVLLCLNFPGLSGAIIVGIGLTSIPSRIVVSLFAIMLTIHGGWMVQEWYRVKERRDLQIVELVLHG